MCALQNKELESTRGAVGGSGRGGGGVHQRLSWEVQHDDAASLGVGGKPVAVAGVRNGVEPAVASGAAAAAGAPGGKVARPSAAVRMRTDAERFAWSRDDYNEGVRTAQTWSFFLGLQVRRQFDEGKWAYPGGKIDAEEQSRRRRRTAAWVRENLLRLGPTFIKVGQLFSSRSDLLPKEWVEELGQLQDRVPAFSGERAVRTVEEGLGGPVSAYFASFDMEPVAAASLGQVHRATLRDGREVAVKVQRPGLKRLFDIDLKNLKILAERQQAKADADGENADFVGIYEECAAVLYREIDYILEGQTADRFRRNFAGDGDAGWVKVPRVHWAATGPTVLTMEYCPGVKISERAVLEAAGVDVKLLASRATESYLRQILRHGLFHADPHPGNLSVDPRTSQIIYYDFGMACEIAPDVRDRLLGVFYATYERDADMVVEQLIALGALVPTGDLTSVRRSIQYFIDRVGDAAERGQQTQQLPADADPEAKKAQAKAQESETLGAIGEDLFAIALDQPFRFPATFTFVVRAFTTLEGVGKGLDPDYDFGRVGSPYAQELLDLRPSDAVANGLDAFTSSASKLAEDAGQVPDRVRRVEDVLKRIERGDLRPRTRALEAERALRRASVFQGVTLDAVLAATCLNVSMFLSDHATSSLPTAVSLALALAASGKAAVGLQRVRRLDRFENKVKGG